LVLVIGENAWEVEYGLAWPLIHRYREGHYCWVQKAGGKLYLNTDKVPGDDPRGRCGWHGGTGNTGPKTAEGKKGLVMLNVLGGKSIEQKKFVPDPTVAVASVKNLNVEGVRRSFICRPPSDAWPNTKSRTTGPALP